MNSPNLLSIVHPSLKNGPVTLEQLCSEYADWWQPRGWSAEQVSLWLACVPTVQRYELPSGEVAYTLDSSSVTAENSLADELVDMLKQADRPMPLAQLLGKFPAGRVPTEPMLRAAAVQDARLELKGPLLKLA